MATTTLAPGQLGQVGSQLQGQLLAGTSTSSKMEIEDQGIKDHIDEKIAELKKDLTREDYSNDKIQDLTDLIMVVLDEIKHIKQTIKDEIQQTQLPLRVHTQPAPVTQTPGQIGSWSGTSAMPGTIDG